MTSTLNQDSSVTSTDFAPQLASDFFIDPTARQSRERSLRLVVGGGILILVLAIELVASVFLQRRAQQQLVSEFAGTLALSASAYGQAGLSPLPDTAPALNSAVALLEIPALGLSQVVVEGSASQATQRGPAHIPGSVLPGQIGEAVIVGHRTTFGAPFIHLDRLKAGDLIKVTTVEGPAIYKVLDAKTAVDAAPENRLVLRTSSPAVIGTGTLAVMAQLQGKPYIATPRNSPITPTSSTWPTIILLSLALFGLSRIVPRIVTSFGPLVSWVLIAPLGLAVVTALAISLDQLLPATL